MHGAPGGQWRFLLWHITCLIKVCQRFLTVYWIGGRDNHGIRETGNRECKGMKARINLLRKTPRRIRRNIYSWFHHTPSITATSLRSLFPIPAELLDVYECHHDHILDVATFREYFQISIPSRRENSNGGAVKTSDGGVRVVVNIKLSMIHHDFDSCRRVNYRTFDFELVLNLHLYSRPLGAVKMRLLTT